MHTPSQKEPGRAQAIEVAYAYASSPNAQRFGFGKTGCYTVGVLSRSGPIARDLRGFASKHEAFAYASTLSLPFHHWSIQP